MLFVVRDQRTQDQRIGDVINQAQVGQRLAGHLAERFAGDQRLYAVTFCHFGRGTHHHTFEDNAHLTVVDFLENFPDDRFEINSDKTHAVGAAKAVPQIMRHLTHANFMRRAAEVKEAVMHAAAATHQHITGNTGVETTGNERQHIFLGADRETANTFVAAFNQQETIVFHFQMDSHIRIGQLHARGFNMLI